jgi:hypothetical protein
MRALEKFFLSSSRATLVLNEYGRAEREICIIVASLSTLQHASFVLDRIDRK